MCIYTDQLFQQTVVFIHKIWSEQEQYVFIKINCNYKKKYYIPIIYILTLKNLHCNQKKFILLIKYILLN